jgi:hypothetical protein
VPLGQSLLPGSGLMASAIASGSSRSTPPHNPFSTPFHGGLTTAQILEAVRANLANDRYLQDELTRLTAAADINNLSVSFSATKLCMSRKTA